MTAPILVCGRCYDDADRHFVMGTTTRLGLCVRCNGQGVWLLDGRVDLPRLADRRGSESFSTSCALMRYPTIVWDVNGYYAALGVRHDATRAELRRAYTLLGGQGDDRLTYILTRLLDPEVRARYDACVLGDVFMDRFVMEQIMERARQAAADAVSAADVDVDDLDDMSAWKDLLDLSGAELDRLSSRGHDEPQGRQWGYFLWQSAHSDDEALALWHQLLADAFWSTGTVERVGIGFSRGQGPWAIHKVGETTVIFLDEEVVPTESHAREVVSTIRTKERKQVLQ